jgi:hypothetical protein
MKKVLIIFLVVVVLIFIFGISIYGKPEDKYYFEKVCIRNLNTSNVDLSFFKTNCLENGSNLIGITFHKDYCSVDSTKSQFKLSAIEPGINGIVDMKQVDSLNKFFLETSHANLKWVNRDNNKMKSVDTCLTLTGLLDLIRNNKREFRGIRYDGEELIFSGNNNLDFRKLSIKLPSFLEIKSDTALLKENKE